MYTTERAGGFRPSCDPTTLPGLSSHVRGQERYRLIAMVNAAPVALSVSAEAIVREIVALGVTHVVNVPDTHQRTVLAALARESRIRLLTACTEDEAIAINAGLWIGGQRPFLSIQHVGLLAALNNVKGIRMDARI